MSAESKIKSDKDILKSSGAISIKEYFTNHAWVERECVNCGTDFLLKAKNMTSTCGRTNCSGLDFLEKPKRKRFLTTDGLALQFASYYTRLGYEQSKPIDIVNNLGSTLFIGTAGQIFDNIIFNEAEIDIKPKFVVQPVIRLQGKSYVGEKPGFSTSFVNIAVEQINPTIEQHVTHMDNWLTFMSKTGLFMGDVTVRIVKDSPEWGDHKLDAITTKIYYGGLEIGVANWFVGIPQKTREPLHMSDISFGLERMVWVANKSSSYYDAIGPLNYSFKNDQRLMDCYRTAVLMSLAGVQPDIKDRSSKLRGIIREISDPDRDIDRDLIRFYTDWWKKFSKFEISSDKVIQVIVDERNRNINIKLKNSLGLSDSIQLNISPLEYVSKALEFGIPFDRIKESLVILSK